uniref:Uncharacterized protein n=1 Tax=Rhizophora mucronata TaxID=61149 RepID=A0A2P2PWZ8_RHIMU
MKTCDLEGKPHYNGKVTIVNWNLGITTLSKIRIRLLTSFPS